MQVENGSEFVAAASKVQELCAQIEEALLQLSQVDLIDVATGLGIRQGRLKDQQGKTKSKLLITQEISSFVKKSVESVESGETLETLKTGLDLLQPLYDNLKKRLEVIEKASPKADAKREKSKHGASESTKICYVILLLCGKV